MNKVVPEYKEGLQLIGLQPDRIPLFEDLNSKLEPLTGWRYQPVKENLSYYEFLIALSEKVFMSSINIRTREELGFCKLPDIFHDVYGHAALLTYKPFAEFLEQLGKLGVKYGDNPKAVNALLSMYWYTAEVGLIYQDNQMIYYGGSIISSVNEIDRVYSDKVEILPFNVEQVMSTPYDSYQVNDQYYVINDLTELNDSLGEIANHLEVMRHEPLLTQ